MSIFQLEIINYRNIPVVRWRKEGDENYYVSTYFSAKTLNDVQQPPKIRFPIKRRKILGYINANDLNPEKEPTKLHILVEIEKKVLTIKITNKRAIIKWPKTLRFLLTLTPNKYNQTDRNPFQRMDNRPQTKIHFQPTGQMGCDPILSFLKKDFVNNQVSCSNDRRGSKSFTGHSFIAYRPNSDYTPPAHSPSDESITKTHKRLFDDSFTSESINISSHKVILKQDILAWATTKRHTSQRSVMNGHSANETADTLSPPLPAPLHYEWLHLVAHRFGPASGKITPQQNENLVLGTHYANSLMMAYEELITRWSLTTGIPIRLITIATHPRLINYRDKDYFATWMAKRITYQYSIGTPPRSTFWVIFSPFITTQPAFATYLLEAHTPAPSMSPPAPPGRTHSHVGATTNAPTPHDERHCEIVYGDSDQIELRPIDDDEAQAFDWPIAPLLREYATIAKTDILGQTDIPVVVARTNNGARVLSSASPIDNFTFSHLFNDFDCEEESLFVFDDVKFDIITPAPDSNESATILFSGCLRTDRGPVAEIMRNEVVKLPIQKIYFSGEIDIGNQNLAEQAQAQQLTLTSTIKLHLPILKGINLTSAGFWISIGQYFDYLDDKSGWSIGAGLYGSLEVDLFSSREPAILDGLLSYQDETLHLSASCEHVDGLLGIDELALDSLQLHLDLGAHDEIEAAALFSVGCRTLEVAGKLSPECSAFRMEAEEFTLDDLHDLFTQLFSGQLTLPEFPVTFDDLSIAIATADGDLDGVEVSEGLTLSCSATLHDHTCKALISLGPHGVVLSGELDDFDIDFDSRHVVRVEQAKLRLEIHPAASGLPSEFSISGRATIKGLTIECGVQLEKGPEGFITVLYAELESAGLGLSTVFPPLKGSVADGLKFSKAAFIYASDDCTTQDPDLTFPVKKGLQLMAVVDEIPSLGQLTGHQHTDLVLSACFGEEVDISVALPDTRLWLGPSVTCDPFAIEIRLLPKPALDLVFGMDVAFPNQPAPLHFDLVLELGVTEAKGSATMKGWWEEPFGIAGLKIGPAVAAQIGIVYAEFPETRLPSDFGITGGLTIGEVHADLAVDISGDPTSEVLVGELTELTPKDLVSLVSNLGDLQLDESEIPDFFELRDLGLYFAPAGGSIGTVTYDPGVSLHGTLVLFGKHASIYATLSQQGIIAKGEIDALKIGPLEVSGEHGKGAKLDLELTGAKQSLQIDGMIRLPGVESATVVDLSKKEIIFDFEERVTGLFNCTIHGHGALGGSSDGSAPDSFQLHGEFDEDLNAHLAGVVAQRILDAIASGGQAEEAVKRAKKAYDKLFIPAKAALDKAQREADAYLKRCLNTQKSENDRYEHAVSTAKMAVELAKTAYDDAVTAATAEAQKCQKNFDTVTREVDGRLRKTEAKWKRDIDDANEKLDTAHHVFDHKVSAARRDCQVQRNKLKTLGAKIDHARDTLKRLAWHEAYKRPVILGEIAGWKAEQVATNALLSAANGALSVAQHYANGLIETASKGLQTTRDKSDEALKEAEKEAADQRQKVDGELKRANGTLIVALKGAEYTAWRRAQSLLHEAETSGREALDRAEAALGDILESAVYQTLNEAKRSLDAIKHGSEATALDTANALLEGAKYTAEALSALDKEIKSLESKTKKFIEIESIKVDATVSATPKREDGTFAAEVHLKLLQQPIQWTQRVDFKETKSFIEEMFKNALKEAKGLIKP